MSPIETSSFKENVNCFLNKNKVAPEISKDSRGGIVSFHKLSDHSCIFAKKSSDICKAIDLYWLQIVYLLLSTTIQRLFGSPFVSMEVRPIPHLIHFQLNQNDKAEVVARGITQIRVSIPLDNLHRTESYISWIRRANLVGNYVQNRVGSVYGPS